MTTAWLYITTNLINGKKYIGQTITPKEKGYLGSGVAIMAAIKKYGRKNFDREDVYEGEWESVDLLEAMYIEKYNAIRSQLYYNQKEGGHHGKHNNPITSKKISESALGRKASPESRKVRSKRCTGAGNSFYGKKHSDDAISKIKEARSKQILSEESNRKRSAALIGLKKEITICPNCNLIGGKGNLVRYHFNNCKKKKI